MPPLSANSLRLAFLWGAAGALLGGFSLSGKAAGAMHLEARLLHADWMLYGWMMQTVFATAYWIFPRILQKRPAQKLALAGFVLWNLSLAADLSGLWIPESRLAASILRLTAAALFVMHFVPRLRPVSGQ